MRLLSRAIFREILSSALLGALLFTFLLFLRSAGSLFEILVRNTAPPPTVGYLFWLVLPQVLPFTLPLAVLVGVLVALGRMSTDGEVTGMRAAGVPGRVVMRPILLFAVLVTMSTAACSLWLKPWSMRETYRVINQLIAAQLTAEIQPRVFAEQFPNRVLYVGDVISTDSSVAKWRQIFMADLTPPEERPTGSERGDGPRVTLAVEALAVPDVARNRIQLTLLNGSTYEVEKDIVRYNISGFPSGAQILDAQRKGEVKASRESIEMDTIPLYRLAYKTPGIEKPKLLEARIELHQRLALPLACILLALVGIPLGVSSRKGGKSSAIVVTIALAFLYYMGMISLINLARQGTLPVPVAVWLPNALFGLMGIGLMWRLEKAGDRDIIGSISAVFREWKQKLRPSNRPISLAPRLRIPLVPGVVDTYVLSSFLFYFLVLLASFILMFHVFTFFELLSDMVKNKIPFKTMGSYLFFLSPKLIYDFTPFSVLVGVLISFGVLSKHNEVTALKACGVSVYRLAVPIVLASTVMSGGLFAFDHYWVPEANRRQDALRNEIKGKPIQTYLRPDRKWIFDYPRIFYYKYFDQNENLMVGVHVYDIDPKTFSLSQHITAEKARWEPALKTWVFQNGWAREIKNGRVSVFHNFTGGAMTFKGISETPDYFVKEVKQSKQMNFQELDQYIRELQQGGFDTVPLQVQYHKKFSVPVFVLIMALISIPLAFLAGNRGAMTGVGLSFIISIAYASVDKLFEQVGNVNQLPASVAAWAPAGVFALASMYFVARMRT